MTVTCRFRRCSFPAHSELRSEMYEVCLFKFARPVFPVERMNGMTNFFHTMKDMYSAKYSQFFKNFELSEPHFKVIGI